MRKNYRFSVLSLFALCAIAAAQVGSGMDMGVGGRALSFAGNHTAVANDLSAAYWNPAALAFLPVREFQLSFDGMRTYGICDVTGGAVTVPAGARMSDYKERMRLSGAGAMTAIPTVQGGLTLAAAYERPFAFDDFSVYSYRVGTTRADTTRADENVVRIGDLNRWSGAFGVQIAPKIAAGLTVSMVTGSEETIYDQKRNGEPYNEETQEHGYLGYALSGGLFYLPADYLKLGFRVNATMDLSVRETRTIKWNNGEDWRDNYDRGAPFKSKGRAYKAPNGAFGAGLVLPWLTTALDIRFTMPYTFVLPAEDIPGDIQARYFKVGAGIGFEAPLPMAPVVLRAGYSYDECDLYPVVHKFDYDEIDWDQGRGFAVDRNKHTLAAGIGVFTSGVGFELSYGYQTWGISHDDGERVLKQIYDNHRMAAAIIFRY